MNINEMDVQVHESMFYSVAKLVCFVFFLYKLSMISILNSKNIKMHLILKQAISARE